MTQRSAKKSDNKTPDKQRRVMRRLGNPKAAAGAASVQREETPESRARQPAPRVGK
jgi:hypothetical protein